MTLPSRPQAALKYLSKLFKMPRDMQVGRRDWGAGIGA